MYSFYKFIYSLIDSLTILSPNSLPIRVTIHLSSCSRLSNPNNISFMFFHNRSTFGLLHPGTFQPSLVSSLLLLSETMTTLHRRLWSPSFPYDQVFASTEEIFRKNITDANSNSLKDISNHKSRRFFFLSRTPWATWVIAFFSHR